MERPTMLRALKALLALRLRQATVKKFFSIPKPRQKNAGFASP
jgi:hypothetical protein